MSFVLVDCMSNPKNRLQGTPVLDAADRGTISA